MDQFEYIIAEEMSDNYLSQHGLKKGNSDNLHCAIIIIAFDFLLSYSFLSLSIATDESVDKFAVSCALRTKVLTILPCHARYRRKC